MSTHAPATPVVVWWFRDGKRGHENQSRGLIQALARRLPLDVHEIRPGSIWRSLWTFFTADCERTYALPRPELLIGAGHRTHLPMLAARRACGGRSVVLMSPSLPCSWFDLCLIPEHDQPKTAPNVLTTWGALNTAWAMATKAPGKGMILIGGPSVHCHWSDEQVLDAVRTIADESGAHYQWTLATSRRTPAAFVDRVLEQTCIGLRVVPYDSVPDDWLAAELADCELMWVTADSVSMVYEGLTAGAAVGVISPGRLHGGRVLAGLKRLIDEGLVSRFEDRRTNRKLSPPVRTFDESARCARWIAEKWLSAR